MGRRDVSLCIVTVGRRDVSLCIVTVGGEMCHCV